MSAQLQIQSVLKSVVKTTNVLNIYVIKAIKGL